MKKHTIDPQGDLCLVTSKGDDGEVGFIVNSNVLRIASKVFAAMLSGKFAEGQALSQRTQEPVELQLPEDDTAGMKIMLEFLHFCPHPKDVPPYRLIPLATLVDKYNCVRIFTAPATQWMKRNVDACGVSKQLSEYLGMAIAFKSPEVFTLVATGLAMGNESLWYGHSLSGIDGVENTALGHLVKNQTIDGIVHTNCRLHQELTRTIGQLLHPLTMKARSDPQALNHHATKYCRHDESTMANFYRLLAQENVMPCYSSVSVIPRLLGFCRAIRAIIEEDKRCKKLSGVSSECTACKFICDLEDNGKRAILDALAGEVADCCYTEAVGLRTEVAKGRGCACPPCTVGLDCVDAATLLFGLRSDTQLLKSKHTWESSFESAFESSAKKLTS